MARPIKKLTDQEGAHWIGKFSSLSKSDNDKFMQMLAVSASPEMQLLGGRKLQEEVWGLQYQRQEAAKESLEKLYVQHVRGSWKDETLIAGAGDVFTAWRAEYISDDAWLRVRNADRQKKHQSNTATREQLVAMPRHASYCFTHLAENAGVSKKDYLDALAHWLTYEDNSKFAKEMFNAFLKKSVSK